MSAEAHPSIHPGECRFLGYYGHIRIVEPPTPAVASGQVGDLGTPVEFLAATPVRIVEIIADHLMLAHDLAKEADEKALVHILELALFEVGRRLAQAR